MSAPDAGAGGRLTSLASQLRRATAASRAADYRRMASVISHCADEIEGLVVASASRRVIESAVARAQRALDVWQALSSF
jgi:hypothetical protein